MTLTSIGDLAQTQFLQRRNTDLKTSMLGLSQELATGRTSDIADHLGGSYSRLTFVERDMRIAQSFQRSLAEYGQMTGNMQTALEQVSSNILDLSGSLVIGASVAVDGSISALASRAEQVFANTVSTLNQTSAGRSVFSGDNTDAPSLADGDAFLAALSADIAGSTGAAAVEAAIDAWFSSAAGFGTSGYLGSTNGIAPLRLSSDTEVNLDIRADDPAIRDALKGLAMAAIVEDPALTLTVADQDTLLRRAGEMLLGAQDSVTGLQAELGFVEEQVETWSVKTASEITGLEYTRNALLEVDPFRAATELEEAQFQLESLYSITVRLSQLSLVNFLR